MVEVSREDCLKTRSTSAVLLPPTTVNWAIPETKIGGGGIPINFVQVCSAQGLTPSSFLRIKKAKTDTLKTEKSDPIQI